MIFSTIPQNNFTVGPTQLYLLYLLISTVLVSTKHISSFYKKNWLQVNVGLKCKQVSTFIKQPVENPSSHSTAHWKSLHTFIIINPKVKAILCGIFISKHWHEAVENFCNEQHDETAALYFSTHWHSQFSEAPTANLSSECGRGVLSFLCIFFPIGTAVSQAQAQHPDGTRNGITYSIFSGNKYHSFSISSSTGQMGTLWNMKTVWSVKMHAWTRQTLEK